MPTSTPAPAAVTLPGELFRISLDLYHRMAELGVLTPRDRVELLDGLLVKKAAKSPRHATASHMSSEVLATALPDRWHTRKHNPITLVGGPTGGPSEPEPDLAVVRGVIRDYCERHPGPAEVALIVKVADRTLATDRLAVARCAWANIPCVWIVNLVDDIVEVYTRPSGPGDNPGYAERKEHGSADTIVLVIDGQPCGPIAVRDLLP